MKNSHILLIGAAFGTSLLILSFLPNLDTPRILVGIPFVYFFSGYPLGLIFLSNTSRIERILVSSGLSLLLTYPAGFLNVLREGQSGKAIFGYHLSGDAFFLLVIYLTTYAFYKIKKK